MAVTLEFLADISGATKEISGFTKSLDAQFKSITNTVLSFGAALGLGFSFKKAIDEAVRAEDALNNFNIVLKQTGIFTDSTSKAFADFAEQLEKTTSIASEDILDLAGKIQTLTGVSASDLSKITAITIDFAKANNLAFETAGTLVSKAINGQTEALKRYGISLKDTGTQAGNLNNVLNVFSQFQGTAAERALTFSGRINQLKIQFGNLLEEIGNLIIKNPVLLKSFDGFIILFDEIKNIIKENETGLARFVSLISSGLAFALKLVIPLLAGFTDFFDLIRLSIAKAEEIIQKFIISYRKFTAIFSRGQSETGLNPALEKDLDTLSEIQKKILGIKADINADIIKNGQEVTLKKELVFSNKSGRGKIGEDIPKKGDDPAEKLKKANQELSQTASVFISSLQQGSKGVGLVFQQIGSIVTEKLIPGFGGLASSIIGFLAQGPEAVKSQIQGFIDGIPEIITAIVDSIPVVIDTLVERAPDLITRLAELAPEIVLKASIEFTNKMPFVAIKLASSLIAETPNIAAAFVTGLVNEAGRFITAIADGVKRAISGVVGGGGGAIGGGLLGGVLAGPTGAVTGVLKKLKFAEGGVVPGGAPFTDRVPALLTPGEVVLNRQQVSEIQQERQAGQQNDRPLTVNLMIGEEQLANVILSLNRQGFRLA